MPVENVIKNKKGMWVVTVDTHGKIRPEWKGGVWARAIIPRLHIDTLCATEGSDVTLYSSKVHEHMPSLRKHVQSMIYLATL